MVPAFQLSKQFGTALEAIPSDSAASPTIDIKTSSEGQRIDSVQQNLNTDDLRKIAIKNVYAICQARCDYNRNLMNFYLTGKQEDILQHYTAVNGISLSDIKDFSALRKELVKKILVDCKTYDILIQLIENKPHNQELIDVLHFKLNLYYNEHKYMEAEFVGSLKKLSSAPSQNAKKLKPAKLLSKKIVKEYREKSFLFECAKCLEQHISNAQSDFIRENVFKFSPRVGGLPLSSFGPENNFKRLDKVTQLLKDITLTGILAEYNLYRAVDVNIEAMVDKINYHFNVIHKIQNRIKDNPVLVGDQYVLDYFAVHEAYAFYDTLLKSMSDTIRCGKKIKLEEERVLDKFSSAVAVDLCEAAKKELKEEQEQNIAANKEVIGISLAVNKAKVLGGESPSNQTQNASKHDDKSTERPDYDLVSFDAYQKEKRRLYKETVNLQRSSRQMHADIAKKIELEKLNEKRTKEKAEVIRNTITEAEVFQLFENINKTNLLLLQKILGKPKPDNEISYHEIEQLVSKSASQSGKLSGEIVSSGGSHRTLKILSTTGYFDVWGPFWEPHAAGNSKLPRIAVEMINSTLNRAGITAETLEAFLKLNKPNVANFKQ